MRELLWLIPVLPFVGALLNGFVLRHRAGKRAVAWIACGVVGLAAALGLLVIADVFLGGEASAHGARAFEQDLYVWVPAGPLATAADGLKDLTISMGFLLDEIGRASCRERV